MSQEGPHDKSIPICWVSTDDLIHCQPKLAEEIKALTPADVEYIADKVGDALQETYWLALRIVLDGFLNKE